MVISLLQTCINSDYHLPASQTPQSRKISTQTFADYTIQSKLWLAKDVLMCVNIVEYSRRNETGNTASTRMVSKQYLLSLAILSIFSKVRTKSVTSMSINPLIGFTVCSCFLIWVCLYRVCFILQEQSTFKVFWLIGPKKLMQTYISRYILGVFQTFPQFIRRSLSKPVFGGHWFIPAEGVLLIQVSLHPYAASLA